MKTYWTEATLVYLIISMNLFFYYIRLFEEHLFVSPNHHCIVLHYI